MFGNNSNAKSEKKTSKSSSLGSLNSLVSGTHVTGDITCNNDIRVDGKLNGTLSSEGKVIIGKTGVIEGEVSCHDCVIEGNFTGTLNVAEILNIKESAIIQGNVTTNKLIIQKGAVFNVKCTMGNTQFGKGVEHQSKVKTLEA